MMAADLDADRFEIGPLDDPPFPAGYFYVGDGGLHHIWYRSLGLQCTGNEYHC